jgi:hypothetical protein
MNFRPLPRLIPLLLALLPGLAGAADWQSLLGNSPFGATGPAAAATAAGDFEFRGVVQEEGVYFVNLYNPTTKTSQWIEVSGKVPGLEVQSYDPGADKVQITQAGRSLTLPLKQARVALVAAAAPPSAGGDKGANPDARENLDDRRAQVRDMVRARLEGGPGGEPSPLMRNLPPEAQAMIEEYRRRRADRGAGQSGAAQPAGGLPAERVRRGQPQN